MKTAPGNGRKTGGNLHSRNIGAEHVAPAGTTVRSHAKGGGKGRCGGVNNACHMRVIIIQPMHEQPVQHHRIAQRQTCAHADHLPVARPKTGQSRQSAMGKIIPGRGQCNPDSIKDQMARTAADIRRDIAMIQVRHEGSQLRSNQPVRALHLICHLALSQSFAYSKHGVISELKAARTKPASPNQQDT